jgi:hypothetical protein
MTQSFRSLNLGYAQTSTPFTAVNQALTIDCDPAGTALFQVLTAASLTGCTLTFEGRTSESAPWIVLAAYVTNATAKGTVIAVTPALSAVPANGWLISTNGCVQVRARVSAVTTGSIGLAVKLSDSAHG